MSKTQLIKSTGTGSSQSSVGKWNIHDSVKPFIQGIIAGDLDINQVSSTLISGVPTPWARAKLFCFVFDYLKQQDANITTSGLIDFYGILRDEWKGTMALIALFPDRVSFSEPIYMNPKERNLFELSSAFGRMLLDDVDIWTDQQKKQRNPDELPYIQLLRYNGQLIGGTSPFSIFFPAVEYNNLKHAGDIPWYRNGKFEDPMKYLDKDKTQKLYLFLKNINGNFKKYENNINISRPNNRLDLSGLKTYLRKWLEDIELKENNLQKNGTVAKYYNLAMPYKSLLESQQHVYRLPEGSLTFDKDVTEEKWTEKMKELYPQANKEQIKEYFEKILTENTLDDLQNILKEDKKIIGWFESSNRKNPLSAAAVYYLKVNDVRDTENPTKYFSLPLSMEGIQMFTQQLGRLVSHQDPKFDIVGKISEQGNLIVDLTVSIDNQPYKLNSKEYEIEWGTSNNSVIMWPDFISDNWDAYYLYSEYPLNVQGVKFVPFFKRGQEQKIITVERPHGNNTVKSVVYSNSPEDDLQDGKLDITQLVTYPAGQVPQEMHKYEVLKSNRPIAGLEIRIENAGKSLLAGYLIVKNPGDETMGERKIADLTTENISKEAIVGIDFGSNNSCVHYTLKSAANNGAQPILFNNRRLALVGIDAESGATAQRDELLFFSNEPTPNGQIKSWLHEHDVRYIGAHKNKEIAGGVAVNEKNILVKEMDREKITTQAGILNYNMKWLPEDSDGNAKKTAYLKVLWLAVCADLYSQKCRPVELRWSFPGSMSSADLIQYNAIYNGQLPSVTPIIDKDTHERLKPTLIIEQTEAESVCKYALSRNLDLDRKIFLGIDVGGSTSDILILSNDVSAGNAPRLYKQSSIRIAAGVFFDAISKSAVFRRAIFSYHQGQRRIKVENINEILTSGNKAPFYLNSLFDQLSEEDFAPFYSHIASEAPFVYSIPAFVTGLLIFYSGKLSAIAIKEGNLTVNEVHLLPFGKGGRLFHWLQTIPGSKTTNDYLELCFKKGYGEGGERFRFVYRNDITKDNKSEVSKGLAVDRNELIYESDIRFKSDIFGESEIRYLRNGQFEDFDENEIVDSSYFSNLDFFEFPDNLKNFETFLRIFIDFVGHKAGLVKEIAILEKRSSDLSGRLKSFIKNDSEYDKALRAKQKTGNFEYRFPILIAEGLCYLEQILIPEIFKS